MPLEDFLMPGENVRYSSPDRVEYQGGRYQFLITDRRLLWYVQEGLIFKKDRVISENIGDIVDISYREKGILSKKSFIKITTTRKKLEFSGSKNSILTIYQELQTFIWVFLVYSLKSIFILA